VPELSDIELRRARWRRHRRPLGLENVTAAEFGEGGLASRLESCSARYLLMPADPDQHVLDVASAGTWLKSARRRALEGGSVELGTEVVHTAHGPTLVTQYGDREPWRRYLAMLHNGGLDLGLGSLGARTGKLDGDETLGYRLTTCVSNLWALLDLHRTYAEVYPSGMEGPWELTLSFGGTAGSVLCEFGEDWSEPGGGEFEPILCPDAGLLWIHELEGPFPNGATARDFAYSVGDRLENAWGTDLRRYLNASGPHSGQFNWRKT
jgi:hypothetical protein